jgi:hypothetical protein
MYTQIGPQGIQGFGNQGTIGPQGEIGFTGLQGTTGSQGESGNTGPQGLTGPTGDVGPQGATGINGIQGPTGPVINLSAGVLYTPNTWSQPGDGSIVLPDVVVALYDNSNFTGLISTYSVSGGTFSLVNEDTNYISISYNSGNPIYSVDQSGSTINGSDVVRVMTVYRLNNFIHTLDYAYEGSGLSNKISNRIIAVERFSRESGLIIGLSGSSGIVELSSGVAWNGTNRQSLAYLNSFDDIFFKNYHSSGNWSYSTAGDYLNNLYYDNGTDIILASASKYLVNWYFRGQEINDHLYEVYGTNQYDTISEAQLSTEPNLPELVTSHAFLVGRVIVQVGTYSGFAETSFTTTFQATNVQSHNDLTNIQGGSPGEYYHLSNNQYNNLVIADGSQSIGNSLYWNGTYWQSYSPFYYQDTAPSITSSVVGSRWLDSTTGDELVLVDDGDTIQWVQPYSSPGGGGGGGGVGTQGPQGLIGTQGSTGSSGNTGPQGILGPQGPGSSSFLYENVLFVHPNGDDGTAVIGDRSLPFNTLFGAINAASLVTNPVIEVWSGDTYDPIAPVYEYSQATGITIDYNLTIYLKPNVHIALFGGPNSFFTITSGARVNIIGDEKSSSIRTIVDGKGGTMLFDVQGSKLYIENISIYYEYSEIGAGIEAAIRVISFGKGSSPIVSLKNCYLEFLEDGQSLESGEFSAFINEASNIEIDGCQLYMSTTANTSGNITFIKNNIQYESISCDNSIRNSQFLTIRNSTSSAIFSVIFNNDIAESKRSRTIIDDCVFYIDKNEGSKGGGPYVLYAPTTSMERVNLVSRSIHNYASTDSANVNYTTGEPSSLAQLGVAGYGFLETYTTANINIPFIRK